MPQWLPQSQFAGYYVAYEKGIYKKHGLDITIIQGGPDTRPVQMLEEGGVDFVTLWLSTAIRENDRGKKIVSIAQMIQKSALMLIAKKSSGIYKPEDINNKKVSLWGDIFQIQPREFFKKFNLDVTVIPQSYSVNLFLRDGVDVASAMWYNEYHTILNCGYDPGELTTFFYYDYGLNFPEDGLYVMEDYFEENPELCRSFAEASLEGWEYAFEHPEEALDIIIKYMEAAHIPANRVHQKWMLERMKDLMTDGSSAKPSGKLSESDYTYVSNCLKQSGLVNCVPGFSDFYKGPVK
ncbi:MAG: ABC transporter substrate-binding protein [Candidatus Aureabacteria bacterium]|nr:ABC transporter substrate-binding protein [Candidatus Auribacterota bacterium]